MGDDENKVKIDDADQDSTSEPKSNVTFDGFSELEKSRKCYAFIFTAVGVFIIAIVNIAVFCALKSEGLPLLDDLITGTDGSNPPVPDMPSHVFWIIITRKIGFISFDIAATYFAIKVLRIAERLLVPLAIDEGRLRALLGDKERSIKLNTKQLKEIADILRALLVDRKP